MYRTIDSKFWTDPKIHRLQPIEKLFALYLITNPHTHVGGIYYLPDDVVTLETGVPKRNLDTIWDTLSRVGFAKRDAELSLIWVINMFRYQGKGEKNEISVATHLKALHNSFLVKEFLKVYPAVAKRFPEGFSDRVSDSGSFCHSEQEQEQEQEKEQDQEQDAAPAKKSALSRPTIEEVSAYCLERKNTVDPQRWFDHYSSNGWRVGKNPMRDWKAAVRTWERNGFHQQAEKPGMFDSLIEFANRDRGDQP